MKVGLALVGPDTPPLPPSPEPRKPHVKLDENGGNLGGKYSFHFQLSERESIFSRWPNINFHIDCWRGNFFGQFSTFVRNVSLDGSSA